MEVTVGCTCEAVVWGCSVGLRGSHGPGPEERVRADVEKLQTEGGLQRPTLPSVHSEGGHLIWPVSEARS